VVLARQQGGELTHAKGRVCVVLWQKTKGSLQVVQRHALIQHSDYTNQTTLTRQYQMLHCALLLSSAAHKMVQEAGRQAG
jgi:hypothetical protein